MPPVQLGAQHAVHARSNRQPARQERSTAGAAIAPGVILGEFHPLGRHPVQVGRADRGMAITAQIAVTQVVCQQDHNIGTMLRSLPVPPRTLRSLSRARRQKGSESSRRASCQGTREPHPSCVLALVPPAILATSATSRIRKFLHSLSCKARGIEGMVVNEPGSEGRGCAAIRI